MQVSPKGIFSYAGWHCFVADRFRPNLIRQMNILLKQQGTNASGYAHTPIYNFSIRTTRHSVMGSFALSGKQYANSPKGIFPMLFLLCPLLALRRNFAGQIRQKVNALVDVRQL